MSRGHCKDMAIFEFENNGRRHLGFLKFEILMPAKFEGPMCITMPNFTLIGKTVAKISFQDGGRPPSWIFKSWKW